MVRMSNLKNIFTLLLFVVIGLTAGFAVQNLWNWYQSPPAYLTLDNSAHFIDTSTDIVIYTTSWCPYCRAAKQFLDQRKVAYTEYDIEKANEQVLARYGSIAAEGVPKIVFRDKVYIGFNRDAITKQLEQISL